MKNEEGQEKQKPVYTVLRVCGWCKASIGTKETDKAEDHGKITHTVCPACLLNLKKDNNK